MVASPRRVFQPISPEVEQVGKVVLDAAFTVHTELGPGLLESVYRIAMKHVIETNGMLDETEVKRPIMFRGVQLESGLRLDMLVNHCASFERWYQTNDCLNFLCKGYSNTEA